MRALDSYLLTVVTFLPLVGALLLIGFPRRDREIRWFALLFTFADFVVSLHFAFHFDTAIGGFQFQTQHPWISTPKLCASLIQLPSTLNCGSVLFGRSE